MFIILGPFFTSFDNISVLLASTFLIEPILIEPIETWKGEQFTNILFQISIVDDTKKIIRFYFRQNFYKQFLEGAY